MARNEVFKEANYLSLPVPTGTLAGSPLRIGGLNVVTQTAEASVIVPPMFPNYNGPATPSSNEAGYASCALIGGFNFPLASGTGAVAVGDPIYITSGNVLTTTASGNQVYGHALSTKASGAGNVIVRLYN